jgi:5'(3')-deoxyribonucleotidase
MDDVLADFYTDASNNEYKIVNESLMWDKDFFLNLKPTKGSHSAIRKLISMGFDVFVLTQPLAGHPECYYDKALWIQIHFPQLYDKIVMSHDKGLCLGKYLIDDNLKWKEPFENNGGKFLHFAYGSYNLENTRDPEFIWKDIIQQLELLEKKK